MKGFFVLLSFLIPAAAGATTQLSDFVEYTGPVTGAAVGQAVTADGDINGDGYADFITGSDGGSGGIVYLTYGQEALLLGGSLSAAIPLQTGESNISFGTSSTMLDLNGDGFDEVVIGVPGADTPAENAGGVRIVYGSASLLTSTSFNSAIHLNGESLTDHAGHTVANGGDLNADGFEDLLVGAYRADSGGGESGSVYVIYGRASVLTTETSLGSFVELNGQAGNDQLSTSMSGLGDVNADGFDDFAVGAPFADSSGADSGTVYIVHGRSTDLTTTGIATVAATILSGKLTGDEAGHSVSQAGDMNGDGFADIVVGAYHNDDAGANAGVVYIVYSSASGIASGKIDAVGAAFTGVSVADVAGATVGGVGDVNGDGFSDVMLASLNRAEGSGAPYLIYGAETAYTGSVSLSTLPTLEFTAAFAGESAGSSLGFGDLNGDALEDVIIGARANDDAGTDAGAVYIGYLYIDSDHDGTPGTEGLLAEEDPASSSDCNDGDGTVSEDQTYYTDADGDGLGSDTSTEVCSSTAPEGTTDNSGDVDDTVVNDGVEIGEDFVDNDGDEEVDEDNTVEENGPHPGYEDLNPAEEEPYVASITQVKGGRQGRIRVFFSDGSVYKYTIFPQFTARKKTKVKSFSDTGLLTVTHAKGKKLALVNVYTGEKLSTVKLGKKKYSLTSQKQIDLRQDGKVEVVVTSSKKQQVRVSVVRVKVAKLKLKKKVSATSVVSIRVKKTQGDGNQLHLRNKKNVSVVIYKVTKKYRLRLLDS